IDLLHADLQSPASTTDGDGCWSAPASGGAAGGVAAAMFAAEHECPFDHVRNDRDALGIFKHLLRNAFVRCSHDLVQNRTGVGEAVKAVLSSTRPRSRAQAQQYN